MGEPSDQSRDAPLGPVGRSRTAGLVMLSNALHRLVFATLVCLGAAVIYWVATPVIEGVPALLTLPQMFAEWDATLAWSVLAVFLALTLLTEFSAISYCMYRAWRQPRIVHVKDVDSGVSGHFKITGSKASPASSARASRLEICAYENMDLIRERLEVPKQVEIDLLIEPSDHLNAYTLGMDTPAGGRHVICLSEVLVETLSNASTAAVIGHEMGHVRNRDSATILFMGCFRNFASIILFAPIHLVCLAVKVLSWVFSLVPLLGMLARFLLFLLAILVTLLRFLERVVMFPAHLYERYVSRRCEYLADAVAAHSVGPNAIGRALHLLSQFGPPGKTRLLHQVTKKLRIVTSTHPSFEDRIKAIRNRTYSKGLALGALRDSG